MSREDQPANYFHRSLRAADAERTLRGKGWLSLTQVVGWVGKGVTPECAARHCTSLRAMPLDVRMALGRRRVVLLVLHTLCNSGKAEHRAGTRYKEPFFRVKEN